MIDEQSAEGREAQRHQVAVLAREQRQEAKPVATERRHMAQQGMRRWGAPAVHRRGGRLSHRRWQRWVHVLSCPKPASRARMMASLRSATWSLLRMLVTWLRTVLGLNTSRAAMSGFLWPCAIRSKTSRSRSLSSGKTCGVTAGRKLAKKLHEPSLYSR